MFPQLNDVQSSGRVQTTAQNRVLRNTYFMLAATMAIAGACAPSYRLGVAMLMSLHTVIPDTRRRLRAAAEHHHPTPTW